MSAPRILIAGLRGGGGKTLTTLGLTKIWNTRGHTVAPFKKGPDYIDAAWLTAAAGCPCRNLDAYLMLPDIILDSFTSASSLADIAIIEGNRGLYDGMNPEGTYSTAELAKLLRVPVILVVDCTKTTRTIAATVLGCQQLDRQVDIKGVILNCIAGKRHESVLRRAVAEVCKIPVLGAIPRLRDQLLPERHLGLVPPTEHGRLTQSLGLLAESLEQYLDLDALWDIAHQAPALEFPDDHRSEPFQTPHHSIRIGIFRDAAFQFYYPENLEALLREGAQLTEISPLHDRELPPVDALYIGGGFPETSAPALAANTAFLGSVRTAIEKGLPVYAECGGAVYLGQSLHFNEKQYNLANVLPVTYGFQNKPQGHGYTEIETVNNNPFFAIGDSMRGHEFHYTYMQSASEENLQFAFRINRGHGFDGHKDGLCHHNVLASYTHLHALGVTQWAPSLVGAAIQHKQNK